MKIRFSARNAVLAALALPVVFACESESLQPVVVSSGGAQTSIELPQILRTTSAIDVDELQLRVTVNNVVTDMQKDGDDLWSGSVNVPLGQRSDISVEWSTAYGESDFLPLAVQSKSWFGQGDPIVTFAGGYNTNYDNDNDSDGRFNLAEIQQNRSPLNFLDVNVGVDGDYVSGGIEYPSSTECGTQIPITVQTAGLVASMPTDTVSDHQAWWCATLNTELTNDEGTVLPIPNIEFTVNVQDNQLVHDSGEGRRQDDDSIEIFIDGDLTRGQSYDGANDFQMRFTPTIDGEFRVIKPSGFVSQNMAWDITTGNGSYKLKATIPLSEVGITLRQAFGLNVEINDDDDGGLRDNKYAWVGTEGVDVSYYQPLAFGTAQVYTD